MQKTIIISPFLNHIVRVLNATDRIGELYGSSDMEINQNQFENNKMWLELVDENESVLVMYRVNLLDRSVKVKFQGVWYHQTLDWPRISHSIEFFCSIYHKSGEPMNIAIRRNNMIRSRQRVQSAPRSNYRSIPYSERLKVTLVSEPANHVTSVSTDEQTVYQSNNSNTVHNSTMNQTVTPVQQSIQQMSQSVAPVQQSMQPMSQSVAPVQQSMQPMSQSVTPVQQSVQQTVQQPSIQNQPILPPNFDQYLNQMITNYNTNVMTFQQNNVLIEQTKLMMNSLIEQQRLLLDQTVNNYILKVTKN
jgi:hypothetical protein